MKTPTECTHQSFAANVAVNRLEDVGIFHADVTINCVECGVAMRFIGVPAGWSPSQPGARHMIEVCPHCFGHTDVNQQRCDRCGGLGYRFVWLIPIVLDHRMRRDSIEFRYGDRVVGSIVNLMLP